MSFVASEIMRPETKYALTKQLVECLTAAPEIKKIVIFGSFLKSDSPNDIDVAIFQDTDDDYITLAMKYRGLTRVVSDQIPLDIIPLRPNPSGYFMDEINSGEVVFER